MYNQDSEEDGGACKKGEEDELFCTSHLVPDFVAEGSYMCCQNVRLCKFVVLGN